MIETTEHTQIPDEILCNYFRNLINRFYKILPMREENEPTLSVYIRSLCVELVGCEKLIYMLDCDARFLSLIAILKYFSENPDCSVKEVKREVFKAINICGELARRISKAVIE